MSFADLKKQSKFGFQKLTQEIEKLQTTTSSNDERLWKPEVDKTGNGYAVIRFLPAPEGEEYPWAKIWSHGFQGPGGWYIENSLTSLGQKDPVSEYNRELWNSGLDSDKELARKQKRKVSYYSNIYVVNDPGNPDNNGKVFLFKYGKKIFDKIQAAMKPEFQDETPINPFDFWDGADFKLKIRKVEGYWNYDKSEFGPVSTLGDMSDSELEQVWRSEYSLKEFLDPKNFKTYEELQQRFNVVIGRNSPKKSFQKVDRETFEDEDDDKVMFNPPSRREQVFSSVAKEPSLPKVAASASISDDDDDTLSYFARLAEED